APRHQARSHIGEGSHRASYQHSSTPPGEEDRPVPVHHSLILERLSHTSVESVSPADRRSRNGIREMTSSQDLQAVLPMIFPFLPFLFRSRVSMRDVRSRVFRRAPTRHALFEISLRLFE